MVLSLTDLTNIYSEQLFIELSPEQREQTWREIQQQQYTNAAARGNAYLNYLCANALLKYLAAETENDLNPQLWQSHDNLPSFWQVVNGSAIDVGQTRLILIPSEKDDYNQLRVPREWVELPDWAGDYYLAVQVNLDAGWLQVWGYAIHEQLQEQGRHDEMDETYVLEVEELTEDLTVMYAVEEMFPASKPSVKPLPILPPAQVESLITQLSQPLPYSPRLELPFTQWGALMAEERWRKKLYQRQIELLEAQVSPAPALTTNLGQWFQQVFEAGWQSLDTLLDNESNNLAFAFRQGRADTREVEVKGVKLIDLGVQLGHQSVALLVGLSPETEDRVSIRVKLYPAQEVSYLPAKIKLTLLTKSGKVLQQVQARNQDNFIQLKRFSCPLGKKFSLQVALDDFSLTEDFVVSNTPS